MLSQHLITVHPADLLSARTVHFPQCPVWNRLLNRLKYNRLLEFFKQAFQHRFSLSPHVKYIESIVSLHFHHNSSYTAPGTHDVSLHTHPSPMCRQPHPRAVLTLSQSHPAYLHRIDTIHGLCHRFRDPAQKTAAAGQAANIQIKQMNNR